MIIETVRIAGLGRKVSSEAFFGYVGPDLFGWNILGPSVICFLYVKLEIQM